MTGKNGKRLSGGGYKSKDAALVEELMEWITQQSGANLDVLWKLIMFKAKCLHKEQVAEDTAEKSVFVSSRGWFMNYMKHFGLFLKQKTTTV